MKKSEKYGVMIKAIDTLNEMNRRHFSLKIIQAPNDIVFRLIIIDHDMEERMKNANCNFIDYIPEFKVEIGDSYFWSNSLDPLDATVGLTGKSFTLEQKALLRCAGRVLDVNKRGRQEIFKIHPELK